LSLRTEVEALGNRCGPRCTVALLLNQLDEEERAELVDCLDDTVGVQTSALTRVLRARGHQIGEASMGRHRRRDCACPR
jgi:hypothetical protein